MNRLTPYKKFEDRTNLTYVQLYRGRDSFAKRFDNKKLIAAYLGPAVACVSFHNQPEGLNYII
jgi:hypothetical protein